MNIVILEHAFPSGQKLQIAQGDITEAEVGAIVNAANALLQHGGGVAGVIARRGGPEIQAESDAWVQKYGPVIHDRPAYTTAGRLPCSYVIHAVGPIWGEGDEDAKLAAAVRGSLDLAEELGVHSLALPAISTGIFGFPKERAAGVIYAVIENYFAANPRSALEQVRLVLFDRPTLDVFRIVWDERFGSRQMADDNGG